MRVTRAVAAGAAFVAVFGTALWLPGSATASGPPAERAAATGTLTAHQQDPGVARPDTITRTYKIDRPHKSEHAGWTWNVEAHWKCDAKVDTLSSAPRIYRNDELIEPPPPEIDHDVKKVRQNAAGPCVVNSPFDEWHGTATGYVEFPPGYEPPDDTAEVGSDTYLQGNKCDPPPTTRHGH